jgi:hypothetical protein
VVLVEDAVESILSSDGELVQFPRFDDRLGEWTTGSGALAERDGFDDCCRRFRIRAGRAWGGPSSG